MRRPTSLGTAGRLLALALALGAAATVLASRGLAVADHALAASARVEDWVELAVVGGAALAAAWVALGALLGLAVVTSARAGTRWRAGEAIVHRLAPGLVRRLVRAGIGIGVGTGLALAPTAAMAATPAAGPVVGAVGVAGAVALDVGVARSEPASGAEGSEATALPAGAGGGIDLSWQPTGVPTETRTPAGVGTPMPADAQTPAPTSGGTAPASEGEPDEDPQPSPPRTGAHGSHGTPAASRGADAPAASRGADAQATPPGAVTPAAPPGAETPAAPIPAETHGTAAATTNGSPAPHDQAVTRVVTTPPAGRPGTAAGQPVQSGSASPATAPTTSRPAGTPDTPSPAGTSAAPSPAGMSAAPSPATSDPASRPASPGAPADGTVVVLRGDTLWDLAARWLGGEPTDAQVMAATVRWHEANRDVIGDDADVILPGQILTPPA